MNGLQADVVLHPGELYFSTRPCRIYTLLGSCVAVTIWHPQRKIGGMCHYLLAEHQNKPTARTLPPGYFAEDAFAFFDHKLRQHGVLPKELEVKIFGGGNMFNNAPDNQMNVAANNISKGQTLIAQRGWQLVSSSVGGDRYRKVHFDMHTGDVWMSSGRQEAG